MWIEHLMTSRTTRALELAGQFAEARHKILAENLANIDTPDYHTKQLAPEAFQASLRQALQRARQTGAQRLDLRGNAQFSTGVDERVHVKAAHEPAPNVLFQDGTNPRLEQLLADVSQNSLDYETATTLLRGRFENLLRAIRGRTT